MIKDTTNTVEMILEPVYKSPVDFNIIILKDDNIIHFSANKLRDIFALLSTDSLPLYITCSIKDTVFKFDFQEFLIHLETAYEGIE